MNVNWTLGNEMNWKLESSLYSKRLENVNNLVVKRTSDIHDLATKLPTIPLSYHPSQKGSVAIQLSIFVTSGCIYPTLQCYTVFLDLFQKGCLCTFSLPVRLIFEIWGAAHYALKTINEMQKTGNIDEATKVTSCLLLGARSPVKLPWSEEITDIKSIHVMEFIRSLKDTYPSAEETYDFLCESCHPSHLRLSMWSIHNWMNEVFRQETHGLINRTLEAVENALDGVALDTKNVLEIALPHIEEDIDLAPEN